MYVNWALETFLFFIIFILRFTRGLHEAIFYPKMQISGIDKIFCKMFRKSLTCADFKVIISRVIRA